MHFLAHYYTELPNAEPLFVAGLTIPDLTPGFTRLYNSLIVKHTHRTSPALKQIQNGIVQHFGADKRFHSSPLFARHVSNATRLFLQAGLSREKLRLSVIAHIAVEMIIDRLIMKEHTTICGQYYQLLGQADELLLTKYFHSFGIEEEKSVFLRSFQFYKQKKILFLFSELENIVEGLNRVYSRISKVGFTEEEKGFFLTALYNIDNDLRYSWQEILERN